MERQKNKAGIAGLVRYSVGRIISFLRPWGLQQPEQRGQQPGFRRREPVPEQEQVPEHRSAGLLVLPRRFTSPEKSIEDLTEWMLSFACQDRRARIAQRNHVEGIAPQFDWENLIQHYQEAYRMALERLED